MWSLYLMAAFYVFAGVMHFVSERFYLRMMPPYVPNHRFWVLFTGVLEAGLGLALLFSEARVWAAWGIIGLLVLVFPANIHMAFHAEKFRKASPVFLWLRLPLQFLLIWWAYQFTMS
jgi:uncharacterized membrane protein